MNSQINKAQIDNFDLYKDGIKRKLFIKKGSNFDASEQKIIFLLHDAQNFFQQEEATIKISWNLPETLNNLNVENYLAFGLSCLPWFERIVEYSPFELREELRKDVNFKKLKTMEPGANKYLEAIFSNLIPNIEKKYDFSFKDQKTIMIGSSMGGLVTTYCSQKYPSYVDGYIAFSNCFYANYPQTFDYFSSNFNFKNYYHYMGGKENSGNISNEKEYIKTYNFLEELLIKNKKDYGSSFNMEGKHSEIAWQKELPNAVKWILKNLK